MLLSDQDSSAERLIAFRPSLAIRVDLHQPAEDIRIIRGMPERRLQRGRRLLESVHALEESRCILEKAQRQFRVRDLLGQGGQQLGQLFLRR